MRNGKKTIRKELIKNMIFNIVLFTILFTVFSLFIFYQVDKYLYTSIDSQLMQIKANLSDITKMNPPDDFKKPRVNENSNTVPEIGINYKEDNTNTNVEFGIINEEEPNDLPEIPFETDESEETELGKEIEQIKKEVDMRFGKVGNLRVVAILRDEDGQILGTSYRNDLFSDFINGISFDKGNVGKIYNLSLNDEVFYRGTAVEIESNSGEKYYVDLLINTNSENEMLNRFLNTLTLGTGISILLSIFISYYLANKSIKPIVKSYEKQSEFVQNASHELRTPLTIIQAKQEMLLQSPNSKIIDKSEDIALTLNETRRLSKMVSELMELARDDANRTVITKTKTNINALINEITIPYKEMAQMQEKEITINTKSSLNLF